MNRTFELYHKVSNPLAADGSRRCGVDCRPCASDTPVLLLSAGRPASGPQSSRQGASPCFRTRCEPADLGGTTGDYLPLAADRAPFSQSLIADDRRTFQASAELLGGPTVPAIGIATCFTGDSAWHTRQGAAIGGVTFWADLEPRTGDTGALRLVPGSHLPDFKRQIGEDNGAEWSATSSPTTSSSTTRTTTGTAGRSGANGRPARHLAAPNRAMDARI